MKKNKDKNNKKLVPRLRFPDFKDAEEWEKEILENISPAIFDGTHQTPRYREKGIPFFSVENIVSGNQNKFISMEDYLTATSKNKPEQGDILITRIGTIGFSTVVTWDYEFSIYVTLAVIKKSEKFKSYYLHSYFQSKRYQLEILRRSLLNAVPCKINMNELCKTEVLLPKPPEQQKIADCLSSIDELISLLTQKLAALKDYKKGLMQKLFPAEGETVPEFRFPGFKDAGEWEKEILENLCVYISSGKDKIDNNGKYNLYGSTGIIGKTSSGTYDGKYLLVARVGANAGLLTKACGHFGVTDNTLVICIKDTNKIDFLYYSLDYFKLNNLVFGSGQPLITGGQLKNLCINIPPSLTEQQKIADCLSAIDELISKQIQKVESLKEHKKGLMQQLFPSPGEVTG